MKLKASVRIERAYHVARALGRFSTRGFGLSALMLTLGTAGGSAVFGGLAGIGLAASLATVLGAWVASAVERRIARNAKSKATVLTLAPNHLIAGERRVAIEDVKRAWIDEVDDVKIELTGGDRWTITDLALDQQQRLLEHLECTATQRALNVRISAPYLANFGCLRVLAAASLPFAGFYLLAMPFAAGGAIATSLRQLAKSQVMDALKTMGIATAVIGGLLLLSFALYRYYRPSRLRVGTDGVRVETLFGHRYVPYREVKEVVQRPGWITLKVGAEFHTGVAIRTEHGVKVLTMESGEERQFKGGVQPPVTAHQPAALVLHLHDGTEFPLLGTDKSVARRIREVMATHKERRATGLRIERLDRGELDNSAWKERLNQLAQPTGNYRQGNLGREGLLEVLEDPGVTPEQRVAAAYALSQLSDPPTHRVRIAAQSCADDALRVAIEEAAEGELDEARIQEAMDRYGES